MCDRYGPVLNQNVIKIVCNKISTTVYFLWPSWSLWKRRGKEECINTRMENVWVLRGMLWSRWGRLLLWRCCKVISMVHSVWNLMGNSNYIQELNRKFMTKLSSQKIVSFVMVSSMMILMKWVAITPSFVRCFVRWGFIISMLASRKQFKSFFSVPRSFSLPKLSFRG